MHIHKLASARTEKVNGYHSFYSTSMSYIFNNGSITTHILCLTESIIDAWLILSNVFVCYLCKVEIYSACASMTLIFVDV